MSKTLNGCNSAREAGASDRLRGQTSAWWLLTICKSGDWRAAYAIYEENDRLVTYYRVEYDAEEARRKMREVGLPLILGDRLLVGK